MGLREEKAFLNMKVRDERQKRILADNLEQSKLNVFALQAGMGASANFRNFSDMMVSSQANRTFFASPMLALTNPFAWMSEMMDLRKEKNFFETRVTDYQTGGALSW